MYFNLYGHGMYTIASRAFTNSTYRYRLELLVMYKRFLVYKKKYAVFFRYFKTVKNGLKIVYCRHTEL